MAFGEAVYRDVVDVGVESGVSISKVELCLCIRIVVYSSQSSS